MLQVVPCGSGMRWFVEIVFGSEAEPLALDREVAQNILLCFETMKQRLFTQLLLQGQGPRNLAGFGVIEKMSGFYSFRSCMIEGAFDDQRSVLCSRFQQSYSAMHGERAGVVVRMTGFVGVSEDDFGLMLQERAVEMMHKFRKVKGRCLIGDF